MYQRADERQRDEYVRLDVELRHQPDDLLKDYRNTAQNYCRPRDVKRQRLKSKQAAHDGYSGYHEERDVLF